jgi:hypothetical protein
LQRFPIPSLEQAFAGGPIERFAGGLAGTLLDQSIGFRHDRKETPTGGHRSFRFSAGEAGVDLLLDGWSIAEPWGTWSVGDYAGLRLPVAVKQGLWKVVLTFRVFGKWRPVPVEIAEPAAARASWRVSKRRIVKKELIIESHSADVVLRFAFPKAASPLSLGKSEDRRRLGMGLIALDLTEPS